MRPYVIVHTHTSIDGNLNGKTSTEDNITHYGTPAIDESATVPAGDYVAEPEAEMYYVSIDPRGELAWQQKLHGLGVERLMVGGGGIINWSFLQQGLVDEVSMVLAPVANAEPDAPRFFTAKEPYSTIDLTEFTITSIEDLGDSVVWLRYTPNAQA
ncbi:dihydrofolate reductase family protein [Hoyosella altamirensis]|uniref:Riboflavin biosynthesis pyrimidine reductase n=1 Tax=Hoyosella altamirensis TaxID=616997 RepID=A0A839RPG2_9ACTN|nr:dihydrofolate reductase family protein [Hoyosella altamirensis]MBB3038078.1 riboflavin biosynthesis pyrimidine reductase [Hoyosella altamirensis]